MLSLRKALYLFMNGDSEKHCLTLESLPNDVVEQILVRLAAKSLLRLKAVSKQWKSTIESRFFQERHLMQHKQSGDPHVLMVSVYPETDTLRTLVVGSSSSVKIPTPWENKETQTRFLVSHSSCDGLICLYYPDSVLVLNPTTRWYRTLPLNRVQQDLIDYSSDTFCRLGFGKDKFSVTYKPVWLYNSIEIGRENATTCEVFDFSTNAWRYVTSTAPHRVLYDSDPVYVDGSLHWFTECKENKVVSMDLHTEAFQVISKTPFDNAHSYDIFMCNLDNCLCVSERIIDNQVIWCFNSGNKTWDKVYFIDLKEAISSNRLFPLANLDGENKNKKLLLYCREFQREILVIHDPETKSYDVAFSANIIGYPLCYYQSLISIV